LRRSLSIGLDFFRRVWIIRVALSRYGDAGKVDMMKRNMTCAEEASLMGSFFYARGRFGARNGGGAD